MRWSGFLPSRPAPRHHCRSPEARCATSPRPLPELLATIYLQPLAHPAEAGVKLKYVKATKAPQEVLKIADADG